MAEKKQKEPENITHLQRLPEFVSSDSMRREEFLSQIGNFAPEHRKIFQSLCENWEPAINYNRFVTHNSSIRFVEKDLLSLLSKLKSAKCGMLKNKCVNGELKKHAIILTDPSDKSFFYHLVDEETELSQLSTVQPMLTVDSLAEQGIHIPDEYVEMLTPRSISRSYFKECKNQGRIFKIPTSSDDYFLAVSGSLSSLVTMCIKRIREGLKNSNILSYVAKLQSKNLMELRKDMSTNDPNFWLKLTVTILDAKEEILQKSRIIGNDFFAGCEIIRYFSENEIKEMEQKRADELELFDEMKTLAHEISKEENYFVDQKDLNSKMEQSVQRWPDFKEKFYENFVKAKKKTQLPQVVYIGKKYIHRDNIYTYFVQSLAQYSVDLVEFYQKLMESLIRTNNKNNVSVFFSTGNFRSSIREKIEEYDPMMLALLDRPAIVSEAVIHTAKKKMKINDVSRIKNLLENYFEPGRLKFKSLESLFNLNILDIFQYAFLKMPIWKQLFIRILGRYDSYRKQFTGMSRRSEHSSHSKGSSSKRRGESVPDFSTMSREERRAEYKNRQRQRGSQGKKGRSPSIPSFNKPQPIKRRYTKEEQNQAWTEFTDSFEKNKQKPPGKNKHNLSDL